MVLDFLRRSAAAPERRPEVPVAPERKASVAGKVAAQAGHGRSLWGPRDTSGLIRNGFTNNPVGYRAVKMIAEAASALPLVLQDAQQRFDQHPVLRVLASPNTAQGQAELFEALLSQLLLTGNSYLEAVGGAVGEVPLELHVLRSDRMVLVPGADGWPVAYEYKVSGRKHRFSMQGDVPPICHIKTFHPLDDHYGFSPMQAAASAVDVHNSASKWSKSLLDNAARPSGAIVYRSADGQGTMSNDQYERLIDEMASNYQGAQNAGRPMLLEGGLDWKPMGFSPSDMEFQKTKESAAREIALAYGVPPMLLGIPGDATYANYQEANRAFYRLTVLPLAQRVAATVGDFLSRFGGEDLTLRPDLDQIPALAVERDAQWRRVSEAAFLSQNEKRALLGLPPLEVSEGDVK